MNKLTETGTWLSAMAGGAVGVLFGEVDGLLTALLIFMTLDYISGVINACKKKELSAEKGFQGILKKVGILICVVFANVLDTLVLSGEISPCRGVVILFMLSNEGISILENIAELGIPIPGKLKEMLGKIESGQ